MGFVPPPFAALGGAEGPWVLPEHLPAKLVQTPVPRLSGAHPIDARARLMQDFEKHDRERILEALAQCGGNQTLAADLLGISRRTLVTRLGQYGLPRPRLLGKRQKPG